MYTIIYGFEVFKMKRNLHADIQLNGGLSLNVLTDEQINEIHLGTLERQPLMKGPSPKRNGFWKIIPLIRCRMIYLTKFGQLLMKQKRRWALRKEITIE